MTAADARLRVATLLEVTEQAATYVSGVAYAEALAGDCTTAHAAARVAHVRGIADGVRSALFAIDGANPEDALRHLINEHAVREQAEEKQ